MSAPLKSQMKNKDLKWVEYVVFNTFCFAALAKAVDFIVWGGVVVGRPSL